MQAVTKVRKTTNNHSKRHPQKTWTETIIPNLIIASSRMLRRCIFFCFISQPRIIIRIKFYLFILTIYKRLSHTICTVCVIFFLCLVIRSKNKCYVKIIWNKFTKTNIQSKPVSTSFEVKTYNHCLHQLSVCFDNRIPFNLLMVILQVVLYQIPVFSGFLQFFESVVATVRLLVFFFNSIVWSSRDLFSNQFIVHANRTAVIR